MAYREAWSHLPRSDYKTTTTTTTTSTKTHTDAEVLAQLRAAQLIPASHYAAYMEMELQERVDNMPLTERRKSMYMGRRDAIPQSCTALQFAHANGVLAAHDDGTSLASQRLPLPKGAVSVPCICGHTFYTTFPMESFPPLGECPKCGLPYSKRHVRDGVFYPTAEMTRQRAARMRASDSPAAHPKAQSKAETAQTTTASPAKSWCTVA